MERKILVAVDGSVSSYNALRYLSELFTDQENLVLHLVHIVLTETDSVGMDWIDPHDKLIMSPQVKRKYESAKRFMEEAVMQLGRRGIVPDKVETEIQISRQGIAEDIINIARNGLYDALLIGRRGISKIEEMIIGSVSATVSERCYDMPIWVVDGEVKSRKFLLSVDRSFNSLKAADHLGFILEGNPHAEIYLLHLSSIIGGDTDPDMECLNQIYGKEWCEQYLAGKDSIFRGPEQILLEWGINAKRIKRLNEEICISAHKAIIKKGCAKFGTIVIGRRAKERKSGKFKGVSDKVLELAKHVSIWVI